MNDMKSLLANAGFSLTPEEELAEKEEREKKSRLRERLDRPTEEFKLKAITLEEFERKKYQKDPTDTLVLITPGLTEQQFMNCPAYGTSEDGVSYEGYLIWCPNTLETWHARTKLILDQNFIYREDLEIVQPPTAVHAAAWYAEHGGNVNPGITTKKVCYILDNPAAESYEVYFDSAYPSLKYGKATPNGMFVHKYDNRFHRDMAIMELDTLYSESSRRKASEMTKEPLKANEAIVVSDGCWMKESCSSAFYYIDNTCLIKMVQGFLPTEGEQAVLISEIVGATNALSMCRVRGKKRITYYYDNTSILNVLRNRKTEYIEEVVAYKKLLEELDNEGYTVTFIELHPKSGENNQDANPALMFFHNYCDKECREMSDIFKKDYKDITAVTDKSGKTYKDAKKEFAPKGRPGQGNGNKGPTNNQRNGNNKYGKRF